MKRKLLLLLSIFALCGCSAADDTTVSEITVSPMVSPSPTVSPTPIPTESTSLEDHMNDIVAKAEESAKSSTKITDGPFYDSVSSVYPDVSLTEICNELCIAIEMSHDTVEIDTVNFFSIATSIMERCNIEDSYSSCSFSMFVDGHYITMLTLVDYNSSTDFFSSEPVTISDEYKVIVSDVYSSLFSSRDISNHFDSELDKLRERYSVPSTSDSSVESTSEPAIVPTNAPEFSELFTTVYLPYAKRNKLWGFNPVKSFVQTCGYTSEIIEPTDDSNGSITVSDSNGDYVYFYFIQNQETGMYNIMSVGFYRASTNSEVSVSNYSSDGSRYYDKFGTHVIGESTNYVQSTDEQQSFLFQ